MARCGSESGSLPAAFEPAPGAIVPRLKGGVRMRRSIAYVVFLAIGVIAGFAGNEAWRDRAAPSTTGQPWIIFMRKHEELSHDFIMKSDAALRTATGKPGTWN